MTTIDESVRRPRFGLIADDLTGACDASVQFAARGFSTVVCIDSPLAEFGAVDLVTLNTSSRNDGAPLADQKVRAACDTLREDRRELIFKKIDSTLRGNLCSEIVATMRGCGFACALVAPAYPAMGRTVESGVLRVAGTAEPLAVNLAAHLRELGAKQIVTLERDTWAQGPRALAEKLGILPEGTFAVMDSITDGDLEAFARAGLQLRGRALLVGSAGLAAATAKAFGEEFHLAASRAPAPVEKKTLPRPSVFLMGSTHPVTQAQMDVLARNRNAVRFKLGAFGRQGASEALKSGRPLLITIEPGHDDLLLRELLSVLDTHTIRGVTLSGGDTALAILRAMSAKGIRIEREVLPGIPFGRAIGGAADGLAVVTKAGGFGNEDALVKVAEFLESLE